MLYSYQMLDCLLHCSIHILVGVVSVHSVDMFCVCLFILTSDIEVNGNMLLCR